MSWRKDILPFDESTEIPSLPGKLWKLLALAAHDMQEVAKNPKYKLHMTSWHTMPKDMWNKLDKPDNTKCYVCMAGSVLANTLKYPWGKRFHAKCHIEQTSDDIALEAIDEMRTCNFNDAYRVLYDVTEVPDDIYESLINIEKKYVFAWKQHLPHQDISKILEVVSVLKEMDI